MLNTRVGLVYGPAPSIGTGIKTAPIWYVLEVIPAFYQLYTSYILAIYQPKNPISRPDRYESFF
jgi:hypothetical protein